MKKILSTGAALVFAGILSAQAVPRHNVGVGFGTKIFEGEDGLASQVLAATTNGSFGSQTFAISSGTLDAEQPATFARKQQIEIFVAENMDNIARDIAVGEGESLHSLLALMEVEEAKHADVSQNLKRNFSTIYSSNEVTHLEVVQAIETLVKA